MKRIFLALMLLSSTAFADEQLSGFDSEKDLPVLNEELRQIRKEIEDIETGLSVAHGWAIVDGADGSPAITQGLNTSSVTDVGVGTYRIVWDRDYTGNYLVLATASTANTVQVVAQVKERLATSTTIYVTDNSGNAVDTIVYVASFGSY
jgi:hypothetical protein